MAKKKKADVAASAAVGIVAPKQEQELDGIKVVSVKREGGLDDPGVGTTGKLRVVLEADGVEKLLSIKARKLAYVQRFDYGMHNAGIESEGTYVPPEEMEAARKEDRNVEKWQADFIITPML